MSEAIARRWRAILVVVGLGGILAGPILWISALSRSIGVVTAVLGVPTALLGFVLLRLGPRTRTVVVAAVVVLLLAWIALGVGLWIDSATTKTIS